MTVLPQTIHVVRRAEAWDLMPGWFGCWTYREPRNGGVIRAFASRQRAERFRERLEIHRHARPLPRGCNPFVLCKKSEPDYEALTRFPPEVLFDWLRDADITPPQPPHSSRAWYWWRNNAKTFTDAQWAHLWAAFDRVPFYEVVEIPMGVIDEDAA